MLLVYSYVHLVSIKYLGQLTEEGLNSDPCLLSASPSYDTDGLHKTFFFSLTWILHCNLQKQLFLLSPFYKQERWSKDKGYPPFLAKPSCCILPPKLVQRQRFSLGLLRSSLQLRWLCSHNLIVFKKTLAPKAIIGVGVEWGWDGGGVGWGDILTWTWELGTTIQTPA